MFYQAKFKIDSYVNGGTLLKAFIPGVAISNKYFINDIANGEIRIDDGRKISSAQRGLLYALFTDIHSQLEGWKESRYSKDDIKELLKAKFCPKRIIICLIYGYSFPTRRMEGIEVFQR